jgi:L-fuculose-phosphate aldolase
MHLEVFRVPPEARVVLHSHAPWSTLMACLMHPVEDLDFMVEVPLLVGRHAYVPFFPPGSRELAEEVGRAFLDVSVNVVQLRNHGQVSLGTSWREALHRLVLFERACWMALQGQELRRIGPDPGGRWRAGLRHD